MSVEGFDSIFKMIDSTMITEEKERKVLNKSGNIFLESAVNNAPVGETERLKKSIKKYIRRNEDGDLCCTIRVNSWVARFTEWGTSQQKKNVGWFDRAITDVEEEAINAIKEELE